MLKITRTVDTVEEEYFGVRLRIARTNSDAFVAKLRRLTKPYKRQIDNGSLADDKSRRLFSEAMAGTVLVGWEGLYMDGAEVPFSEANATDLLVSDPDCREFVSQIAGSLDRFLADEQSELEKKP